MKVFNYEQCPSTENTALCTGSVSCLGIHFLYNSPSIARAVKKCSSRRAVSHRFNLLEETFVWALGDGVFDPRELRELTNHDAPLNRLAEPSMGKI